MLIVLSGLPGAGKTTLARPLASRLAAVYLRIDSIEAPMLEQGWPVEGVGYGVAQAVAEDNLRQCRTVIADCVNPWPLTRDAWRAVATRTGAEVLEVEIICSDPAEHKRRVESRGAGPTWDDVLARDYRAWDRERLRIDTAHSSVDEAVDTVVRAVRARVAAGAGLVITGSMGAGKTTVLGEASDILSSLDIEHAALDLDGLDLAHLRQKPESLGYDHLARVCDGYRAHGVARFLLAAAVETPDGLRRLQEAAGVHALVVCRLRAPVPVMHARVSAREHGMMADAYVRRVAVLERILDATPLETFALSTDGPSVHDVAHEMLVRAGWIRDP